MVVVAVPQRKTSSLYVLLAVFAGNPTAEWHGYALMNILGWRSGKLYPLLAMLEANGSITSHMGEPTGPGRPPRRLYRLTTDGAATASKALDDASQVGT
jgi:PadR family transcriptional regulator, regulatory protein PadR